MISYLEGKVKFKGVGTITLLTGGVGYRVACPIYIINSIKLDTNCALFIHSHIREDCFDLYGFDQLDELDLFEKLIEVSGVGPKTAIGIFNNGRGEKIKEAILKSDVEFFSGVPRLGKKNAQKIIIELRGKLGGLGDLADLGESGETKEVVEALKGLGFGVPEIRDALREVRGVEGIEGKIKEAIKRMGK